MKKPIRILALLTAFAFSTAVVAPTTRAADEEKAKPVELTKENFEDATAEGVVLVDFWAEWCGPCKAIAPVIKELAADYEGKAVIAKVDVDAHPELAKKFKINAIPNLKIMKDGKVVDEIVGMADKATIEKKLKKHL